jgi:hypothetical protein
VTTAVDVRVDVRQASRVLVLHEIRRGLLAFVRALDLAIEVERRAAARKLTPSAVDEGSDAP